MMYKSFDFEKTNFFWPESNMGGASRWRSENWDVYPSYFSLGMPILTFSFGFIIQLKNSYGAILQGQDYSTFRELQILIELIFSFIFQFSISILKIFRLVSHFFLVIFGFWETSQYLAPRVIVQSHFKITLDLERSTDNQKKSMHRFDQRLFELYCWKFWSNAVICSGLRARQLQHDPIIFKNKAAISQAQLL